MKMVFTFQNKVGTQETKSGEMEELLRKQS